MYIERPIMDISGESDSIYLENEPSECPICHVKIKPTFITAKYTSEYPFVVYQCTNSECNHLFIAKFESTYDPDTLQATAKLINTYPNFAPKHSFNEEIQSISPQFCKIYNEAHQAEIYELCEIAGPGYRKSLEFLIKDYLIHKNPDAEVNIKKKALGNCIQNDIESTHIKQCAQRAAWLGNDETHYERKWTDKDMNDLKTLIRLTVHWITNEIITEQYIHDMTQGQK